ncbi:MAG: chitobiase/beta-hexosaminidase C-terminal domain-containing protein, partial [Thermodesulfobacteriota bacterium]
LLALLNKFNSGTSPITLGMSYRYEVNYYPTGANPPHVKKNLINFPNPAGGNCNWNEPGCPGDGQWHALEFYVKLNSACGVADGEARFWYDGNEIGTTTDLAWGDVGCQSSPRLKWNQVSFSGNNFNRYSNYTNGSEQWYAIDDVVISTAYIDPNYVIGGTPPSDTTPPITTASPQGGNYTGSQTVTLTANEPSTTYYTTDGSTPTTLSPTYTSPVSITQDTTLSFFSIDTAGNVESIKTEFYIITPPPVASGCGPLSAPDPTDTIVTVTPAQASQLPSIVSNAGPGTTIFLEDGVYPITGTLRFQSDNVTLRSASGNRGAVIIDGQYQTNTLIQISASYVTIADITLKRTNEHLIHLLGGGHYANLYNLHLLDPTQQFIKENPSGGVVFNDFGTLACSLVELTAAGRPNIDPTGSGCYTGGIDAHQAWGWNVRDNIFKDIYCTNGGVAEHAIHFWRTSRDTVVERNTILNSARGIGFGLGNGTTPDRIYPDDPLAGVSGYVGHIGGIIKNNIIFGNIGSYFDSGIGLEQAWNAEVYHNTVYSSGGTFSSIDTRYTNSNPVIINNLVNPAMTVRGGGNPAKSGNIESASANMFVDVVNGDLHLVESATAAIDNGVFLSGAVTDDIDEDIRDSQPDIGADEYIMGGVDITPPGDITNLQVTPGDGQVSISWINPSDSDYAGVMIRYRTDGTSPVDYTDGQPACDVQGGAGGSNSCVHTGLTNGQTYYYSAFTYDGVPNYSQTVNFTATPNATSNNPPDGIIDTPSGNVGIDVGQSVSFTATGSDPDGDIPISYLWNFGSGSGIPNSEIEDPGGKTFNNVGIFTITFTVTDSKGLSDPTPATVQVTVTEPDTTPPAPPQGIGLRVQ